MGGIFSDFEQALACINYNKLLSKLEFYVVTGGDNVLYKSYLNDIKEY